MNEIVDPLLDPWRSGIGLRALAEVTLLGVVAGPIGFWVLAYRLTYGAESLSHGMLPGLVLAAIAGVPLLGGAAAAAVLAAVLIVLLGRDRRIGNDVATAVTVTGLVGLGALLAFAPATPARLGELLFGDPLSAAPSDLAAAGALAVVGLGALVVLHRPLAVVAFDPASAGALGIRDRWVRLALAALLAASVCVGARGLGALLVLTVLVAPPVAVRRHARSAAGAMVGAAVVAVAAGVVGLYASYHLETAAGASVALALCLAAAIGAALPVRRGEPATA